MEITVRKASPATIQMIGENGDSINVTEEVISTIEETTDKTDELITKQSVLDVFNKQFLERLNLVPKYSKDYFYILTGDPETTRNTDVHGSFFNSLGWNVANSDYGLMTMHDYIRLSDFQDREGDITFDDLVGTFTQTIQDASRLAKYKITIMKGSRKYSEKEVYATLANGNPNMIDFNTVKNSIVGTTEFNTICKRWYQRVLDHAEEAQQRKEYVYRLPDPPPPAQGGVKYFKKEANIGRVNPSLNNRVNTNTAEFDLIFANGIATVHFLLPKVARNVRGFKLRKQFRIRVQGLFVSALLIHKSTGVLLAQAAERGLGPGNHEDEFYFTSNSITLSDKPIDDLILQLRVRTTGDSGDAMAVVLEVTEVIYDDNYGVYPELSRKVLTPEEISNDIVGPEYGWTEQDGGVPNVKHSLVVKDFVFKPSYLVTHYEGLEKCRYVYDRVELWRDGRIIAVDASSRYINYPQDSYSYTSVRERSAYIYSLNYQYNPYLVHDVSNLDIRNGDTLVFNTQVVDDRNPNRNVAINNLTKRNPRLHIEDIYCTHQLIG